jgi:hypothetical protein
MVRPETLRGCNRCRQPGRTHPYNEPVRTCADSFFVPPPIAIAHHLIKSWVDMVQCQDVKQDRCCPASSRDVYVLCTLHIGRIRTDIDKCAGQYQMVHPALSILQGVQALVELFGQQQPICKEVGARAEQGPALLRSSHQTDQWVGSTRIHHRRHQSQARAPMR